MSGGGLRRWIVAEKVVPDDVVDIAIAVVINAIGRDLIGV